MPKLRPTPARRRTEIINAWRRYYDITHEDAAKLLGMSSTTLHSRLSVGDWKIAELHRAITAFRIPPNDALELLTVGCFQMERFMEKARKKIWPTDL